MSNNEEKAFAASKKKLTRERKRGNVWLSKEFASALFLTLSFGFLLLTFPLQSLKNLFSSTFCGLNSMTLEKSLETVFKAIYIRFLLFSSLSCIFALIAYVIQRGWIWVWKKQKEPFFKKTSLRAFFYFFKMILICLAAYLFLRTLDPSSFYNLAGTEEKISFVLKKMTIFFFVLLLVYLLLGIADLFYQRWIYMKHMKMSKREMDEEKKEEEGGSRIRRKRP